MSVTFKRSACSFKIPNKLIILFGHKDCLIFLSQKIVNLISLFLQRGFLSSGSISMNCVSASSCLQRFKNSSVSLLRIVLIIIKHFLF